MPSTITSYFTFTPGTRARSSEVNTNFSNYRGDIVPINTDTASSSDNAHDLGSAEHRWRAFYTGSVNLRGLTTTSAVVSSNFGDTAGGWQLKIGATTLASFGWGEMGFLGNTTTNYTKFQFQSGVAAGALDILMGAATLATYTTNGLKHRTKAPIEFTTASAPLGTSVLTAQTSLTMLVDTTGSLTLCSARIFAKGGGLIQFGMANLQAYIYKATTTTNEVYAQVQGYRGTTNTSMSLINSTFFFGSPPTGTATTGVALFTDMIDSGYSAGEVVYEFRVVGNAAGNEPGDTTIIKGSMFIREM